MRQLIAICVGSASSIAILAICLAYPLTIVPGIAFTVAVVSILCAVTFALICARNKRAFWFTFAFIGGFYLAASMTTVNLESGNRGADNMYWGDRSPIRMPTSFLLARSYDTFGGKQLQTSLGSDIPATILLRSSPAFIPVYLDMAPLQRFLVTGHSVFAIAFGAAAGAITSWYARRRY